LADEALLHTHDNRQSQTHLENALLVLPIPVSPLEKVIVTGLLQKPLPSVDGACASISLCPKPLNGLPSAPREDPSPNPRLPHIPQIFTVPCYQNLPFRRQSVVGRRRGHGLW
jgi:hypothetical protein